MVSIDKLPNGLSVIVEEMPHVESAAYELAIPGGIVTDPQGNFGASIILAELTSRGAGELTSRQLSDEFEGLGIRHGEAAEMERFSYRGNLIAENIEQALKLTALMVLEPSLPESEIESIQSLLIQDIDSLNDQPSRRAMIELTARYFSEPHNRWGIGNREGILNTKNDLLRKEWQRLYRPSGAVLSVAGKVTRSQVLQLADKFFGKWTGQAAERPPVGKINTGGTHHIPYESAQLQITMSYPSSAFGHRHYYTGKVATNVLSGGMFGRLFIEVREKRGLVYNVSARHSASDSCAQTYVYAGTTPDRAHETLEVIVAELKRMTGTVSAEELARAKANIIASVVIGEESSSSRASSNVGDWWVAKRVRTLEEIQSAIKAVTLKDIDEYMSEFPPDCATLLTLGSRELKMPGRS
jgi:predicted Zn-dependent peptidase